MIDVLSRLNDVFQDVFDDEGVVVTRETTVKDIEGWDSLMHVTLLLNIEIAFGIKLRTSEIAGLNNVGEMADLIARHLSQA